MKPEDVGSDTAGLRVPVPHKRAGLVNMAPTRPTSAPSEVGVLVVEEQVLIEEPHLVEMSGAEQCRPAAPGEHLLGGLELTLIALGETSVAGEPEPIQLRTDVVDGVEGFGTDNDLRPESGPLTSLADRDLDLLEIRGERYPVDLLGRQPEGDPSGFRVGIAGDQAELGTRARPSGELLVARAIRIDRTVETLIETQPVIVALTSDSNRREAHTERFARVRVVDTVDREFDPVEPVGEEHFRGHSADIGCGLHAFNEPTKPTWIDGGVVVEQRDVVDVISERTVDPVSDPEIATSREAEILERFEHDDLRELSAYPFSDIVEGAIVDENDLDAIGRPVERPDRGEAIDGHLPTIEGEHDHPNPREVGGHRVFSASRRRRPVIDSSSARSSRTTRSNSSAATSRPTMPTGRRGGSNDPSPLPRAARSSPATKSA